MKKNELSNYFTNSNTRTTLFSIEFWSLVLVHSVILFPPLSISFFPSAWAKGEGEGGGGNRGGGRNGEKPSVEVSTLD